MAGRSFLIAPAQWSRFVASITPTLAELLTAGLLNCLVDDVELVGGNCKTISVADLAMFNSRSR